MRLNVLSLCAGAGGLDLGLHIAEPGARTVAYVEREAFAAARLVARMGSGELDAGAVWSDLATFDARAWRGAVDCVVSGDPCQPNSVAGKRQGADDDRWLAEHVVRIFDESGADRLFRENVPGNAHGQLGYFVPALERLGCRVAVGIFSAAEAGASHQRERLFLMADREGGGFGERGAEARPGRVGYADGGEPGLCDEVADPVGHLEAWRFTAGGQAPGGRALGKLGGPSGALDDTVGRRWGAGRDDHPGHDRHEPGAAGEFTLADADGGFTRQAGAIQRGGQQRLFAQGDGVGGDCLPLCAPGPHDPRWPAILARAPQLEPAVRRVADGLAHRVDELRLCGNGVFPLAVALAWRSLDATLAAGTGSGRLVLAAA